MRGEKIRRRLLAACLVLAAGTAWGGINSWTMTGPEGGPVNAIAIHPEQSDIAIASTPRGLYRTTNGGDTWTLVNDTMFPNAQRIVFDPTSPDRVFVINGNLWRSDNAGQTFALAQEPSVGQSLLLDITSAGNLYVGSFNGTFFKSTDHGSTWTTCGRPFNDLASTGTFTVARDGTQDRLYVTLKSGTTPGTSGTWRSVDGCATWLPPGAGSPGAGDEEVRRYAVMPGNPNRVLAATSAGMALSVDGGATWASTWPYTAWWVQFDPTTPDRVFAMQSIGHLIRSPDNGSTWNFSEATSTDGPVPFALDPQRAGRMMVGTIHGPMVTDASGQFIRRVTGIRAGTVANFSAAKDGSIYTVLNPGAEGVFRRDPVSGAWQPLDNAAFRAPSFGSSVIMSHVAVAPSDSSLLYAGVYVNALLRSTTGGASWQSPHTAFRNANAYMGVTAVDPTNAQVAYTSTTNEGLWKTVDGGITWLRANNGLPLGLGPIAIDPVHPNVVYVAGKLPGSQLPDQVYKSTDSGASWSATGVTPPWPQTNEWITALTVDPGNPDVLYAAYFNQIYKSVNAGSSWAQMSFPGAAGNQVFGRSVLVDPAFSSTVIVTSAAFYGAFLRTVDGGATWAATPISLPSGTTILDEAVLNPLRPNQVIAAVWGAAVAEYEIATDLSLTVTGSAAGATDLGARRRRFHGAQ